MKLGGTYTALITPFKDGSIGFKTLEALIHRQAQAGNHLVPMGTTGESATVSADEHKLVVKTAVSIAQEYPDIQVLAGVGSNNTREAVEYTKYALDLGADAGLSVGPYYNKPSQDGYIAHQEAIAEVGLPIVLYNVPSRTGSEMLPDTIISLSSHENVIGIKAAAGFNEKYFDVLNGVDENFTIVSGDDELTYMMMKYGGAKGVVSVASNLLPRSLNEFVMKIGQGDFSLANQMQEQFLPLFHALMAPGNPRGVKTAMELARSYQSDMDSTEYTSEMRLPLTPLKESELKALNDVVRSYGDGQLLR